MTAKIGIVYLLKMVRLCLEQGTFLAGIIAGRMTHNNKIGMLSDMGEQDAEILMYAFYAFIQGIRQVNQDSQIFITHTNSIESVLENETQKMVATDGVDIIFAMSQNYNDIIICSAYYFGKDVFLINSWYDSAYSKHVITSLKIYFGPIIKSFIEEINNPDKLNPLLKILFYDLSNPDVMSFSWDEYKNETMRFKAQHSGKYGELSRRTRKELCVWAQRIRK